MPPKDGVIDHGLAIDNINNPLWENKVQAGDLIVAIGGMSLDGMGFSDAIDLFRKMPRPLAISFEIEHILSKSKWSVDNKCMAYGARKKALIDLLGELKSQGIPYHRLQLPAKLQQIQRLFELDVPDVENCIHIDHLDSAVDFEQSAFNAGE
ncbi:hypothetical protein PsorP6_019410 [Peronosclerospora sorghi]|nr:hypothetical protein PsorP6_019410 [Peronosclerospora sorghi]